MLGRGAFEFSCLALCADKHPIVIPFHNQREAMDALKQQDLFLPWSSALKNIGEVGICSSFSRGFAVVMLVAIDSQVFITHVVLLLSGRNSLGDSSLAK